MKNFLGLLLLFSLCTLGQRKLETRHDTIAFQLAVKSDFFLNKQNDSALFYADKGIEYSKKNNTHLGLLLNLEQKAYYYEYVKNNYEEAIKIYFEAISIAEEKEKGYLSGLYNNLSILFTTKKDLEKAEFYARKSVETSIKELGYLQEQSALINLGIVLDLQGKYKEALSTFKECLDLERIPAYLKSNHFKNIKREIDLRIAKIYRKQKKYTTAKEILFENIKNDSLKGSRNYREEYLELIKNAVILNEKNTVEKYFPLLRKSIIEERNLENKISAYEAIVLAYNYLNQPQEAFEFQEKIILAKDSLNSKFNKKQIAELETKYQTKQKEAQIIKEQSKKELWTYISFFAFIILIVVAILLYNNGKKRKQLNVNKIELEKLLNQRNMLLRETHHRVKNSFQMVSSLLQLQAQGSEAAAAVSALDSAVERVNSMIILHQQLYAKDNLLGINLQLYINDLIEEIMSSYTSKNINFKANVVSTILDIDTATSIGLLVNELATNSIKYAWQENTLEKIINLTIDESYGEIQFKMFDNGMTKKTKATQQNYGSELIEILTERLEATQTPVPENDFGLHLTFKK
jgi:two-component sensor histidine kinase